MFDVVVVVVDVTVVRPVGVLCVRVCLYFHFSRPSFFPSCNPSTATADDLCELCTCACICKMNYAEVWTLVKSKKHGRKRYKKRRDEKKKIFSPASSFTGVLFSASCVNLSSLRNMADMTLIFVEDELETNMPGTPSCLPFLQKLHQVFFFLFFKE